MAGKFRRKFIDIVSDMVTTHYKGKIPEKSLTQNLAELRAQIDRIEQCQQESKAQRMESMRKLRKLPIEKLSRLLSTKD